MLPASATLFAPAKLTVSLKVTGIRNDGMHLIDAEMVTLDFGDELQISPAQTRNGGEPASTVRYQGAWTGDGGDDDLVSRALRLLGEQRHVVVDKKIRAGAGLGGGSSDAAAVLRAGGFDDLGAAAELGADVAFSLVGGRARVRGIGEEVEPLAFVARTYTLLTPPVRCSTPAVYRRWDEMGGPQGTNGNDLELAALAVEPSIATWRDQLSERAGTQARLAGSGSTWFVEGEFEGPEMVVAKTTPSSDQ